MKYDKAELVEVEDVLKKPTHKCDVCKTPTTKACARCKTSYFCSAECQKLAWKKHKKTCKPPTTPPTSVAELRILQNAPPQPLHPGAWSWRRTHKCGIRILEMLFSESTSQSQYKN